MNALKRLFVFLMNIFIWFPRTIWRVIHCVANLCLIVVLLAAYIVALPFVLIHWVATHPVFFNLFRCSFVVGCLALWGFAFSMLSAEGTREEMALPFIFIAVAAVCTSLVKRILFNHNSYRAVVSHHLAFMTPAREVSALVRGLPSLLVPFSYLRFDPPPVVYEPEPAPEPEPEYYAQTAPMRPPMSVEESRQDVPEHLRDLMK